MSRENLSVAPARIPFLELAVMIVGIAGLAGSLTILGNGTERWWNGVFIVCGFLAAAVSMICDNFIPGYRRTVSVVLAGGGAIPLYLVFIRDGDGPDIGAPLVTAIGAALLLSAILRSVRGGFSSLIAPGAEN